MLKFLTSHLQTKLIIAFLALLVPAVAISVYAVNAQTNSLIDQARSSELAASQAISADISNLFDRAIPDTLYLANSTFIQNYSDAVFSGSASAINTVLNFTPEIYDSFGYPSYAGIYNQVRLLDNLDQEILHVDYTFGQSVFVPATRKLDPADTDLFQKTITLPEGSVFAEQMTLSATKGQVDQPYRPIIRLATPVFGADSKKAFGVLVLTMDTQSILDAVKGENSSQAAYLIDSTGTYLAGPDPNKLFGPQLNPGASFLSDRPQESTSILTGSDGTQFGSAEAPVLFQSFTHIKPLGLNGINWTLYRTEPTSFVLGSVNTAQLGIVGLTALALLIAIGIALLITRTIVRPVQQLATAAGGLSQGNWDTLLPTVRTGDELGALGNAFSVMARELKTLYANLEERVRARTSELETVAKVSAATASILNPDELLKTVSELTKDSFGLYHAHVYLLDESRRNLVLAAGAGEAGQKMKAAGHSIPLAREQSLVARAARTRRGVTVNDITQAPDFLANPILPDTRSELAVPLIVGEQVIGVLDVQSDQVGRFTNADVRVQTTLAGQIAVAVQNARAFTQIEQTSSTLALDQRRAQRLAVVSAALSQTTDERQIMEVLTMSVDNAADVHLNLSYFNVDETGTPVEAVSMFNWPEIQTVPSQVRYSIKNDPLVELWLNNPNRVVFVEDIQNEQRLALPTRALLGSTGAKTIAILPLYFANKWQGTLTMTWSTVHAFSIVERAVLEALPGPVAAVLANRRAYLAEEESRQESEALYQISEQINTAQNEQELVDAIVEHTAYPEMSGITIALWENGSFEGATFAEIIADWTRPNHPRLAGLILQLNSFPVVSIMDPRRVTWSDDITTDPNLDPVSRESLAGLDLQAFVSVPLTAENRWIGQLSINSATPHHYTDRQLKLYEAAAKQVAVAVERMRLQRQTERRANELATVAQVSAVTTTLLNLDELLQSVADLTKERFRLYHAHIYLLDEGRQNLVLAAGAGEAGQKMKATGHRIAFAREQSLVARAARTRAGVTVNDVRQVPDFLPNPLLPHTRSEMAVPMIVGNTLVGVLDVQSDQAGRFADADVRVQATLAGQIAVAVQNARAFAETSSLLEYNTAIFDNIGDGLIISTPHNGRIIDNNGHAAEMLGYANYELRNTNLFAMAAPESVSAVKASVEFMLATGQVSILEFDIVKKDGTHLPVRASTARIRSESSEVRAVTLLSDLTEQRHVQQRAERLAQVSAALSQATDERQIVAALAKAVERIEEVRINLSYLNVDEAGMPFETVMALNWPETSAAPTQAKYPVRDDAFTHLWLDNPNRAVLIENLQTETRLDEASYAILQQSGVQALVVLPLRFANAWQGLITLTWPVAYEFSPVDREVLDALPATVAAVVATRRGYLATQDAHEESATLYQISEHINTAQNEQELIDAIAGYVADAETSMISMNIWENADFDTAVTYEVVADWVRPGLPSRRGTKSAIKSFPLINHIDRYNVNWVDDVLQDPRSDETSAKMLEAIGIRSSSAMPLTVGNRWMGTLNVLSDQPRQHTEREIRLLNAISKQITVAVERMLLQRQTERRASELTTVAQVSAATTTLLNTGDLLQAVADLTKERFGLYHAHIYLLNDTGENLILAAGAGEAGRQMKAAGHRIPLTREQSLVARAARTRQPVTANDVTQAANFLPNPLLPDTRAEMSVPMVVGNQVIGVMDVQSEKVGRFTDEDVRIQTTLADQIAVAVQNTRLYETQVHAAEQLREVDRLKSEFLASMSHELRTPLNSIIGFSEVLADGLDGDLSEEAHTDVLAIHESGEHLLELINDVLDLAKIEAGRMELDRTEVELADVVEEVGRTTAVLLKDKPVEMIYDLPLDLPMLNADAKRLRQILKNLVSNAAKFTEQGQIVISATPTDDRRYVQISVRDSGTGIASEHLDLIFEQFRQVDNSSTRKVGGTGLGLPITRQLVQMHGGQIWVVSQPGEGSTFSFTMPIVTEVIAK